jgi:hypothetical protein
MELSSVALPDTKYQSGEKDITGGLTRTGDEMVRTALYEAANVLRGRITRFSKLKAGARCRQAARFKTGQDRLGAKDRGDPASNVDRRHNLPMERSTVDGDAGMIRRNTRRG